MIDLATLMSTELVTIRPQDNLALARQLMHDKQIHHLPVVDDAGDLAGLVTLSNLLAATDSTLRPDDDRIHAADIVVQDIMVTELATIDEHAGVRDAAMFLEKYRIGCLPVVTDGKLRGIITDTDFVGIAINLLEQLEANEPDDDF